MHSCGFCIKHPHRAIGFNHARPSSKLDNKAPRVFAYNNAKKLRRYLNVKIKAFAMFSIADSTGLMASCFGMFCASLAGGLLPRALDKSSAMDKVGCIGAGLLIGTALCVILPEGFEALHDVQAAHISSMPAWLPNATLLIGFLAMLLLDMASHATFGDDAASIQHAQLPHSAGSHTGRLVADSATDTERSDLEEALLPHETQVSQPVRPTVPATASITREQVMARSAGRDQLAATSTPSTVHSRPSSSGLQVLSGLLVHSAADGMAVGAAAMSSSPAVSLTVAVAMVLHKAPVAFGLSSFLLNRAHWSWGKIAQGCVAFSLTAPLTAIATWLVLQALPIGDVQGNVALALLFSGGTFLYASCIHVLPAVMHPASKEAKASSYQLPTIIFGCFLPLLFSVLLPHRH